MDHLTEGGLLIITLADQGAVGPLPSHYFDPRAKQGKIEAHTTEVVWCDSVPGDLHGPQTVRYYAQHADRIVEAIEKCRPKVILVLSAYLYEAMATEGLSQKISAVIGKAKGAPRRITTMRLKALEQKFEHAQMLILPTPSKNTTDDYIRSLSASVRETFEAAGFNLKDNGDALLGAAKALLVLDEKRTIVAMQNRLRIDESRAKALLEAMQEEGLISQPDENGRRFLKK